jgi:gluconokinase
MLKMRAPAALALDIGTSSVRASIFRSTLSPLRVEQIRYRWHEYPDGRVELDAPRLERWIIEAIDAILRNWRGPIAAVGVATFWHSLMGVDAGYRALTPVIPWSDVRAGDEAAQLRRTISERRVHARTGCRLHVSYWPARLHWFRRHLPRTFSHVRRWITFGEWLERRWLGRTGVSVSQASGTGLLVQDTCRWDRQLLAACDLDLDSVAPIVDIDDQESSLADRLRKRWPALAQARWIPAIGDGASNNVGAGCVTRSRAALMIGTSGALRVLWTPARNETVRQPFGLWRYRLDRRRVVVGGALSNGGNVREWVLDTFSADSRLEAKAAALPPDAHGLTLLPFLAGTRSPEYLTHATATISGLTLATRPEHVLRAALEAVAYRFALIFDALREIIGIREIVAAGGALDRSPSWTAMLSDVLGREIIVCRDPELTSRGAAAVAFEQLGLLELSTIDPPARAIVRPDRRRHAIYLAARRRQRELMARVLT